ncbi:hypothetical protein H9650_11295 [Psychrobacillus sp. Sa2BUA9]|uniref:Uncharacterized protein n=1 Tax=Psychrobacillus faecigallinarum TaxID=2762235 RepID=A0ABR8RA72_9BACI|nr:hypothetical protein [Psychrobacillus faecigallinarum]MBD7944700.1 hypothetical protein [Psychrobacillus faecigallinarum]
MKWEYFEDEYGKYKKRINEFGLPEVHTIERKKKWYDENPQAQIEPQPPSETEILTDYVIEVDYRVTMIELGL